MEVFVARQPIFTRQKKIFGYELLFRDGLKNVFPEMDGDIATSKVLSNIFFSFEMEELLKNRPGLINFTRDLILKKLPLLFPQQHIIIEVLEDIEPDDEIIAALRDIKEKGFNIALDDFVYHEKFKPMMELCRIIKFDLIATPLDSIVDIVKDIQLNWNITLLAEKVETYEELQQAEEMGFSLFQGYFFSKPEVLSKKDISANQIVKLKLIDEIEKKEFDLKKIENLIKKDASVSYKLLKFINSAYFKRVNPINTLKEAITFLGSDELRRFINIVVISDFCSSKPNELIRQSVIRARMCEQCGSVLRTQFSPDELFTLGLFSFMDAILDHKIEEILKHINFSKKIEQALLGKDNEFNKISNIVVSFERGDWKNNFYKIASDTKIGSKLPKFYFDSVKMANSFFD